MLGTHQVWLEAPLVGEQHGRIVRELLSRFVLDPGTGRWALRPGQGGLVVLTGLTGAGKSRTVRELYRALREKQSRPGLCGAGYWPDLQPSGGVTVRGPGGLSVFGYRKEVGPDLRRFRWPAHAVPDFLWWPVTCQATPSVGYNDSLAMVASGLLAHREPARFGWSRARGGGEWVDRARTLLPATPILLAEATFEEAVGSTLADLAGQAVPFGGLVADALRKVTGAFVEAGERQQRLDNDTTLGPATGGLEDPADTVAAAVHSLALPGFPVIIAIEDLHDADQGLLDLLARLSGPAYADRVLVVATAWRAALASREHAGEPLEAWLRGHGAEFIAVEPLRSSAAERFVASQFPGTASDRLHAIAKRWDNPLALALVLDLLVADEGATGDAVIASDAQIAEIPTDLPGLYDEHFGRHSHAAQVAMILDVICGADPATATDFRQILGPDAAWGLVERNWVTVAGGRQGIPLGQIDHDTAIAGGWLHADSDWITPREPGMAHAAWRAMPRHSLRPKAPRIRAEAARVLAEAINQAARHADGTPGLFVGTERWWTRESRWMLALAPVAPDDTAVHEAAARGALELFRQQARVRPQDALRDLAVWSPRWEAVLGPDHPDTLASRNNLAGAYYAAGDLERAIPLFQANLTDSERILGPNHPDTLTS
ncbi:MAG: tetratricopeptide repeat protein, partial [Candidatus Nanopelagicales bacterium]